MRKLVIKIMTVSFFIGAPYCCSAQRVSLNEATSVAQTYLRQYSNRQNDNVARVITEQNNAGNPLMYEIIMQDSTIVLVSGHKACDPILGTYSGCVGIFESEQIPCGLAVLMDYYKQTITYCIENNIRSDFNTKWQQLLSGETTQQNRSRIGPLLITKWGQSESNDNLEQYAYSRRIPSQQGNTCAHCPAGCVAVAMGQVMNFFKYPSLIYQINDVYQQFDWCHMPDALYTSSSRFEHECDAVSELLFRCGKQAEMYYTCSESFTDNIHAKTALINHFEYSSDARRIARAHTIPWWNLNPFLDTIKMSLDLKYPVIMGARNRVNEKLHSFVCDGYRDNEYHFNWGWNGDFNGFYSFNFLGNININNSIIFSTDFDAIVFIHPNGDFPNVFCNTTLHLEDFYTGFYNYPLHTYANFKPYDYVPLTMATLYSSNIISDENWRTIPPVNHKIKYQAYKDIYLQDGFVAKWGCDFTASIDPCEPCEERDIAEIDMTVVGAHNEWYHNNASNSESMAYANGIPITMDGLYPNPTDGKVTVSTDGEVEAIVIYTLDGRPVGGWKFLSLTDSQATLDVSILPDGLYLLAVRTADATTTHKLTVRK